MPGTIFIVDDDPTFLRELDRILSGAGHRTFGYLDGGEAIRHIQELGSAIDVAVIDFVIRGITGFELIGAFRRQLPNVRIVATLPPAGRDLSRLAEQVGADMVIRRPQAGEPLDDGYWLAIVDSLMRKPDRTARSINFRVRRHGRCRGDCRLPCDFS
jgi:CheY-like chemotaxis protein